MENQITAAIAAAGKGVSGLTDRETATILAALRFWQREGASLTLPEWDIATSGGTLDGLDIEEIDGLCERLNQ